MGVVANLLVKISGDSSDLRKELASTRKQIKTAFGNEAVQASQKTLKHVKLLTAGFIGLGAVSVKMAAEVQQTRTALVTLLRSTEKADKLLKDIKTFAATTPFEFKGLAQASQQMIAFGFESKAVVPILRTVGDAVSGLGGDQESMDTIVRVLGQIQTMGRVTSKELMQLARQGINAYQYLADATGKTTAQVQADMKKGSISSSQAIQAIILGMNKQFQGGMENQSKTLLGLWATVRENVTGVMRQIGASISEGFSLEERFGEFSKWLSKFTVEVDNSGFKQAIKDMVPDSVKLGIIGLAAAITAKLIPALVLAAKGAFTVNAAIGLATGPIAIAVAAIAFLATEITGYTSVVKTAIEKTKDWWDTLKANRQIIKDWGGAAGIAERIKDPNAPILKVQLAEERKKRGLGTSTTSDKAETAVEKAARVAQERVKELEDALTSLRKKYAEGFDEKALEKARKAFEKLQKEAENTSKAIETAWLDMTGSQRDILEAWHRDQLEELEKSKAANANYQRDRTRLEETYQEKLRQLLNTEAKERAATIREITDGYKGMYDKLKEMGLKGSEKDLFNLKKAAEDDVKAASDFFDKLSADYTSATAAQKKTILDGLNEAGIAYKLTAEDALDFTVAKAEQKTKRMEQLIKDETEYVRQGKKIQSDIEEAYNQLSLSRLKDVLTKENAMRLRNIDAIKKEMDTYAQAMQQAFAPLSVMFANLREEFSNGFGSAISDVITGVTSLSEAFQAFGTSLLKVIADYYAQQLAGQITLALFKEDMLGTSLTQEIAKDQAVATAKSALIATETAEKVASIGTVTAAQTAAEAELAAAGLAALEAFSIASIAQGAAVAAAWAAAAANVSLASFGANAGPAMAGISATHALTTALSIPKLAEGGLTTGPTIAMIGEGRYKEAVVPLSDKVFDRLADGINRAGGGSTATVNVYGDINSASDEDRIFKGLYKDVKVALMGA